MAIAKISDGNPKNCEELKKISAMGDGLYMAGSSIFSIIEGVVIYKVLKHFVFKKGKKK